MFNTIRTTNEFANKLNNEYTDTAQKIYVLQNKHLLFHIETQNEKIKNCKKLMMN